MRGSTLDYRRQIQTTEVDRRAVRVNMATILPIICIHNEYFIVIFVHTMSNENNTNQYEYISLFHNMRTCNLRAS